MTERRPYQPTTSDHARRMRVYCDHPGTFAVRLIKNGPEVPMKITYAPPNDPETGETLDRSWYWRTVLNGKEYGEPSIQPPAKLWIGREISDAEYRFMLEDRRWAQQNAPHLPEANPTQRPDPRKMEPVKP